MFEDKVCSGVAYPGCAWEHVQMPPTAAATTKGSRPATAVNLIITPYIAHFLSVLSMCLVSSGVQLFPFFPLLWCQIISFKSTVAIWVTQCTFVIVIPHHPEREQLKEEKKNKTKIKQGSRAKGGFVGSIVTVWSNTTNKWVYGKS